MKYKQEIVIMGIAFILCVRICADSSQLVEPSERRIDPISDAQWAVIRQPFLTNGYSIQFPESIRCTNMTLSNAVRSLQLNMKDAKGDEGMVTLADTASYLWYRTGLFFRVMVKARATTNWVPLRPDFWIPADDPKVEVNIFHSYRPLP